MLAERVDFFHSVHLGVNLLDDSQIAGDPNMLPSFTVKPARHCLVILFLLGCGLPVCMAQEKPQQNIPTLRTQSNVVFAPTLVKDKTGKPIFGLQPSDFIIEDNGVEQKVGMDEAEPQEPVSLVVAIQTGRSAMDEFNRMKGLSILLDQIASQPQVETAIVTFDSEVNLLQEFTFDSEQTEAHLKRLQHGDDGAVIYDAVQYSVNLLNHQPQDSRRILLLISETRDHGSHTVKLDDAIAAVNGSNTVIYSLAFSPSASSALDTMRGKDPQGGGLMELLIMARQAMRKNASKSVASMTGGEYELFTSRKSFEKFMTEFTNHLHSRYLLRFEPRNPSPGLHEVRVRLRRPGDYQVLARRSYWVEDPDKTPE
jgi:VWFA-related protein